VYLREAIQPTDRLDGRSTMRNGGGVSRRGQLRRSVGRAGRLVGTVAAGGLLLGACDAAGELDPGLLTAAGTIRAESIAFEPVAITLRAGVPITIAFENADDGVPHGLVINEAGTELAATEIITGPARTTLEVPPLTAGRYEFVCPVHPNMTGTITVQP
jgi:plastocyanin